MRIQEHIIHKVTVDINTNSNKVAEELKDTIDTFLKEEIFPLIESLFESISSEDSIKLIPELTLDIDVSNQNFSITSEASRRELKKQLSDTLTKIVNQPEVHNVKIEEKSYLNSKTDTFFSFLENGTFSWWNNHTESFNFDQKDLYEITQTSSFSARFLKVLDTPSQKLRLLHQFLSNELQILFLGIENKPLFLKQLLTEIKTIDSTVVTSESRKEVWNALAHYVVQGDLMVFIMYMLNIIESAKHQKSKQSAAILQTFLKQIFVKHSEISKILPKEIVTKIESSGFSEIELIERTKELENQFTSTGAKETKDIASESIKDNIEAEFTTKVLKDSRDVKKELTQENEQHNEVLNEEKLVGDEKLLENKLERNLTTNNNLFKNQESSQLETTSSSQSSEKQIHESNSIEETDSSDQIQLQRQNLNQKNDINDKNSEDRIDSESGINKKESKDNSSLSEGNVTTKEVQETTTDSSNQAIVIHPNNSSNEELKISDAKVLNDLKTDEQQPITPLKTIKELFKGFNKPKSYIINNAGLILIHPFLKQFFTSCNLLNENNQIINPSEAVHLLHYVATKQEKQLESNLIFEKFLCNVPIHQTIERDVTLSDEMKENTENLLKSVVQNWEILKNSSPDLIRNEFIQRQGKLDLTKDNPQLTIERRTQDILLDKLPWSYGLCKLPWMNTLLFTDW